MPATVPRPARRPAVRWFALLLLALAGLLPGGRAYAGCSLSSYSTPNVTFSVPSTIILPANSQVGDVLYQTPQVSPSPIADADSEIAE